MTMNREQAQRGAPERAYNEQGEQKQLERRRAKMQAAEGHAGSVPRGNQPPEYDVLGHRWWEYQRVLGH